MTSRKRNPAGSDAAGLGDADRWLGDCTPENSPRDLGTQVGGTGNDKMVKYGILWNSQETVLAEGVSA